MWAVINGRNELALLFWYRSKYKLCKQYYYVSCKIVKIDFLGSALFATLLYKNYAVSKNDNSYNQLAEEFETLASQLLDRFYRADPEACKKAIRQRIPAYGNATCLDFAVAADAKQFIAQRGVQDLFSALWFVYKNF